MILARGLPRKGYGEFANGRLLRGTDAKSTNSHLKRTPLGITGWLPRTSHVKVHNRPMAAPQLRAWSTPPPLGKGPMASKGTVEVLSELRIIVSAAAPNRRGSGLRPELPTE